MIHFIMPCDGLAPREIEEHYRPQASQLAARGFNVSIVADQTFRSGESVRGVPPQAVVVYRGWMVHPAEYANLERAIDSAGATLLTSTAHYTLAHHLPNWYPLVESLTPETVWITDPSQLAATMQRLDWGAYFLKDFVKSLKVDGGSIVRTPAEADQWLRSMLDYRDELEGGICLRRVEEFVADSECRYFVLHSQPYAPDGRPIPEIVQIAAERIPAPFFTVDVARTKQGQLRIVEIGDAQVSDLVGWTPEQFASIWPTSECPT